MAASPADCGHVTISSRALALLTSPAALRRLRARYRADPVYEDLRAISVLVLASANGSEMALPHEARQAGLMTVREFAAAAGVTPRAVRMACCEGRIRGIKRSGVWLIPSSELAAREVAC